MTKSRARDLGIPFEGSTGTHNAITDVSGVTVGYATVIEGDSARTGVTIIHPRGNKDHTPVYAGLHSFNGNGEMTGAAWVEEGGLLEGPVGITNTHSVGIVRDTIIAWQIKNNALYQKWSCPVVGETADGWLNDMNGFYVKEHHVMQALDSAKDGALEEGQAVIDIDVDGFADLAVELDDGALAQLEKLADFHAALAQHGRNGDRHVEHRFQVLGAVLGCAFGRGVGVEQRGSGRRGLVAQIGQIDIVGRHGIILSLLQYWKNGGR